MKRRHFLALAGSSVLTGLEKTACVAPWGVQAVADSVLLPASAEPAGEDALYMLTYDHGGLILWGKEHFLERLQNAVSWLDRYPSFKIGLDNEAYVYDRLSEEDPKILEVMRIYLKKYAGRFGIGSCTYGQPLSQFINEESNIRQIGYALEADRKYFGVAPSIYLMSEHAMHSQIPQILDGFGFKGAIMRTHYMMYGYNPTFDLPIGWWVGLDGSRVATVPTYPGEGAEFGKTPEDNWILTRYPGPECRETLEEFRAKFARIKPLLASRADDSGLRREELVRQYEGKPGYRWILLEELRSFFPAPSQDMKTAPNDFKVRMPWGYCGNEIWNRGRAAEVAVLTAERMAAITHWHGGEAHEATLEQAWKDLLVAQHHDIQICGLVADARRFLLDSTAASQRVQDAAIAYAASQLKAKGVGQVTVFNPHSWPRREWLTVDLPLPRGTANSVTLRLGEEVIPSVLLSADRSSKEQLGAALLAFQADIPPLAFVSYSVRAEESPVPDKLPGLECDSKKLLVKSPYWTVKFHSAGGIASILERATGKELFRADRRSGFFAGKVDGKDCESQGAWTLMPAPHGAPWLQAREQGAVGGIPYTLDLTLYEYSPRLDFQVCFHFNNQKIGRLSEDKRDAKSAFIHEEKLRFKIFPFLEGNVGAVRDLPFAIAETDQPYVEGIYWTAVTDGVRGLAWFNQGNMGAVRETDGGWSIPLAHAMYYIWGTRMLNGDLTYEFALSPFSGSWQEANVHQRALEYAFPCDVCFSQLGNGSAGTTLKLIETDPEHALLTALYTKGGATYARFWEHTGKGGEVLVEGPGGKSKLTAVDLTGGRERSLDRKMNLRPWGFQTVRLDPI